MKLRKEGNAEMVERVIRSVNEDGELDPFWASKLTLLNDLGLTPQGRVSLGLAEDAPEEDEEF